MSSEPTSRSPRRATWRRDLAHVWLAALALALTISCASSRRGAGPAWGGDPAAIAIAGPLLAAQAEALVDVRAVEALCQRTERAADGSARAVDNGRLLARRAPPCVVLNVSTPKPRTVREDATSRLVLDPLARGATRWTYKSNSRGLLAVAAVFLDLDGLARTFEITSVYEGAAEGPEATRVVLTPRPDANFSETNLNVERLELVLVPGQAVPRLITVVGRGGDLLEYRIQRPTLDPRWRDPAARFRGDVPAGYTLQELVGE